MTSEDMDEATDQFSIHVLTRGSHLHRMQEIHIKVHWGLKHFLILVLVVFQLLKLKLQILTFWDRPQNSAWFFFWLFYILKKGTVIIVIKHSLIFAFLRKYSQKIYARLCMVFRMIWAIKSVLSTSEEVLD